MVIQKTLYSLPTDLLFDIFSRLSAKSVGRCHCVSKILASSLSSEDFKQFFFTRSLSRPRLLFALQGYHRLKREWIFYSSPQLQNTCEKSSLVLTTDFHTKLRRSPEGQLPHVIYASGVCYLSEVCEGEDTSSRVNVICNPSTKQYVVLPKLATERNSRSCFGFDPIDKQFKVLLMNTLGNSHILTLGTGKLRWRRIQCPLSSLYPYRAGSKGICINGILYYLAQRTPTISVIVYFDVRSETFIRLIEVEFLYYKLLNKKGKLCMISLRDINDESGINIELHMCVLEDVEKEEWSKYAYTLPKSEDFSSEFGIFVVGITATNEIILSRKSTYSFRPQPFSLYYFNPERNTLQSIQVQGFEGHGDLCVFIDHVEDLRVNVLGCWLALTNWLISC